MIRLLTMIFITATLCSCAVKPSMQMDHPTKTMAETWKKYYQECLDENPDNKKKCDELKEKYKMELEKTGGYNREPSIGDESYY